MITDLKRNQDANPNPKTVCALPRHK